MLLSCEEIVVGLPAERAEFIQLLRSLWEDDGGLPTRCEGWSVRAVASHVAGELTDIVAGNVGGQGTPEMTSRHVAERDAKLLTSSQTSSRRRVRRQMCCWTGSTTRRGPCPRPPGCPARIGAAVEAIWYDTYLHHEDILAALHHRPKRGPGLLAALDQVALRLEVRDWGPATPRSTGSMTFPSTAAKAGASPAMRSRSCSRPPVAPIPCRSASTRASTSTARPERYFVASSIRP